MRLVCDADVDRPLVECLRTQNHEVVSIAELKAEATDEDVLDTANRQSALLVTRDKGFGELVYRQRLASHGVLLL